MLKVSTITFAIIGLFLVSGYFATKFGLTNTEGTIDTQRETFLGETLTKEKTTTYTKFPLAHTPEWISFRIAVAKDEKILRDVSKKTGVPERILIAILVPEQMRLFYSNRDLFKQVFSPLKILGSQSQFSWGIFGIKDETARSIEKHLLDSSSPFYLGRSFETMLHFTTNNPDEERFSRITAEDDHTYGYLYTALYVAQIQSQWKKAGHPISDRPDIVATLWNLGFEKSKPNANPKGGGSELEISGTSYSFGKLANDFYFSDEMIELFPRK